MTDQPPTFNPAKFVPFIARAGHAGWLGLRYEAHGSEWVSLRLPWRADLIGDEDEQVLASGPIISLMDMAAGLAIWTRLGVFQPVATLDLRVDYQRPARSSGRRDRAG